MSATASSSPPITESQEPIRLLFAVAARRETGLLVLSHHPHPTSAHASIARLELEHGWVHALSNLGPRRPDGEAMLRAFLLRLPEGASGRFEPGRAARGSWGRVAPFHPAAAVRACVEARLGEAAAGRLDGRAGHALRLALVPHRSCLADDEARVVALLDERRSLADLVASGVAAPARIERLLVFLDAVGALEVQDLERVAAWAALGLAEGASTDQVRRAYHRLARGLHPDLQPRLPDEDRRALEARFDRLARAFRKLVPGG